MKLQKFTFDVHGAVLSFLTNSTELMNEVHKDFGVYETNEKVTIDGNLKIIETDSTFPLRVPKYALRETIIPPNAAIFTVSNLRFIEEKGKRVFKLDFEKNEIVGYIKSSQKYSMFIRFLLKWLLIKALEKKGVSFLHGSGVNKDGSSLFFVGPSGSGKTHTLITFLLKGYKLITDDTIFLKDGKVLPFHLRSKILQNIFAEIPILKKGLNEKSTILPELGWHIDLGDIFPVQKKKSYASKLFYIYVWNASETKIETIPKKEMMSRLFHIYQNELGNSMWFNHNMDEAMKKIFYNYDAFIEKADCFKIYAGSDVTDFVKTVQAT